ncbi:hypothetical protein BLOT_008587 [Blomia tropicalis]|nr:hypothetical protein BLOT_008587 [Blomia tropicalis]
MAEETVKERANRGRTKDDARVVSGRFAADDLFAFILPLTPETVLDATINLTIRTNFDCAILRNTSDVLYGVMTVTLWLNRCLSGAQPMSIILKSIVNDERVESGIITIQMSIENIGLCEQSSIQFADLNANR